MSDVRRICAQCGREGPVTARHCPHCGYDSQEALPVPSSNLALVGRAAVPILAGVASLALRAGWRLLQNRLAQAAVNNVVQPTAVSREAAMRPAQPPVAARPKRTIRIRSSWTIGDASGRWHQGASEHVIEFDD